MIYFTCDIDCEKLYLPGHKEGFGSAFQMILGAYAISKYCGGQYFFIPMKNVGHFEYFDYTQEEWDKRFSDYCHNFLLPNVSYDINFDTTIHIQNYTLEDCKSLYDSHISQDENILIYLDWKPIKDICDKNIHIIDNIKDLLIEYYHSKSVLPNSKVLSIHVRIFSKTDCDPSPWRNYYDKNVPSRVVNTAINLYSKHNIEEVHVHSQGEESDFDQFNILNNVKFFLDKDPIETIHDMIISDTLIMSKSSFSYIASIYRKNTYVLDYFQHTLTKDTFVI